MARSCGGHGARPDISFDKGADVDKRDTNERRVARNLERHTAVTVPRNLPLRRRKTGRCSWQVRPGKRAGGVDWSPAVVKIGNVAECASAHGAVVFDAQRARRVRIADKHVGDPGYGTCRGTANIFVARAYERHGTGAERPAAGGNGEHKPRRARDAPRGLVREERKNVGRVNDRSRHAALECRQL